MFDDVGGFDFTIPQPPEPDRFNVDQSQAEFQQWVNQAIDDFEREVEEIRRDFFQEVADISRQWEEELDDLLLDESDNADFPFPILGPDQLPIGYKLRNARYASADDVATFLNDAGLTGYGPIVVRLASGLWTFALEGK